ncbi:uncharacterized protein BX664DRAFT_377836 [Halteromyces radiatus]|uniref:uncharacterized protein n=1 Tax=Halteromyces radiatus TaxID=101107 RepID=UPI00221EE612|nr:uncharacterized protein BX664DRAFT_377836 [Halteromyces radiatus]KAI8096525.1 hypothetical protein BX664DRAFT_377836 [Halteromyces radiatus]
MKTTGLSHLEDNNENNNDDTQCMIGHVRYRENSVTDVGITPPPDEQDIAKFCEESNYGYSFTSTNLNMARLSSWMRRRSYESSLECVRRIRTSLDNSGRRFSQPDMGVMDKQRSRYEFMTRQQSKNKARKSSRSLSTNISTLYSSLPTSPLLWEDTRMNELPIPEDEELDISTSQQQQFRSKSIVHPLSQLSTSLHEQNIDESLVPSWLTKPPMDNHIGTRSNSLSSMHHHGICCASRYLRALHTPTRFLPQQQAILTTDPDGKILLFNDIACLCLGIDKSYIGRPIFDKFDIHSQRTMANLLRERKKDLQRDSILFQRQQLSLDSKSGMVLMCGVIISIIKNKGQKSAASLWLKEKWNQDQGQFIYLWVFEELFESRLTVAIDSKGMIQDTSLTTIQDLYGYHRSEVIGQSINKILPSLNIESNVTRDLINDNHFYASRSKDGRYFPSMVQLQGDELQITSLPTISGLITIHQNGKIQSMNPVPAKYLFGYKTKDDVETMHVDELLPQFMTLVTLLVQYNQLRQDRMVTHDECLTMLPKVQLLATNNVRLTKEEQSRLIAVHRDGNHFEVELQIRWVESDDETLYSVWITHNRTKSIGATPSTSFQPETEHSSEVTPNPCTTTDNVPISRKSQQQQQQTDVQKLEDNSLNFTEKQTLHHEEKSSSQQQSSKPVFNRFDYFGSVPKEKACFPNMDSVSCGGLPSITFPEFDDYMIVDSLGEGAYGAAKLAQLKSDPSKEFVIKAIVKSRIIIDSWIRDRKYGSIPMEVHILLKLQQSRHVNCPQLVTFFEDDDNYYTVTRLHGDGMDLFDYIELNDHMTEGQVRRIFQQVVAAVQHLHKLRIVHRDIKDENILLDDRGIVQLIDFGSAAYYREGRLFDTFSGTLDYCAPEILNGSTYAGPPQDMWSLGILLYTLIYRETPFYSVDDIMERNLQLPYIPYPEKTFGPVDILCRLLDKDISKRPTIDQVMEDPWLKNEDGFY